MKRIFKLEKEMNEFCKELEQKGIKKYEKIEERVVNTKDWFVTRRWIVKYDR